MRSAEHGKAELAEEAKFVSFNRIEWVLNRELLTSILKAEAFLSDRILQVAYYQLYKETVCTYETLMTKKYLHGRTEVKEESRRGRGGRD
eukprot:748095-Hanusia_phi.AAC.2